MRRIKEQVKVVASPRNQINAANPTSWRSSRRGLLVLTVP
jgi:hypothetical protein